jgi:hypothetical protein
MKVERTYSEENECDLYTISEFSVELGNNFTYDMLMREIYKNEEVREHVYSVVSLNDEVTFECTGLYSMIKEETCVSDIFDHFRAYDKEEETTGSESDIPWI